MTINVSGLSSVPVVGFSKRMVFPGQDVVASRYTGQVQVIGRGPGHWAGSITWMPTTSAHLRILDLLFVRLQGQRESVRLPLPARYRPDVPVPSGAAIRYDPFDLTLQEGEVDNGAWKLAITKRIGDLGAAGYTLVEGQWINLQGRLYQVASRATIPNDGSRAELRVYPPANPLGKSGLARGLIITILSDAGVNAPQVNARAVVPDQGLLSQVGHANDPVVFDWQEVVAN